MDLNIKKEIEQSVQKQLSEFIRQKRLSKKNNRVVNPMGLLKKVKLSNEFASKCKLIIEEDKVFKYKDVYDLEVSKACYSIINYYL